LQADGTTVEKPQLAADTRRMIRAIVGGVMQQAVPDQAVAANPVRDLESPKGHEKARPRGLAAEERAGACSPTSTPTRPPFGPACPT
jgi:hypothetical protein